MSLRPLFDVRVADILVRSPRVREFVLVSGQGCALPAWEAGAHVALHVDGHDGEAATSASVRHYSLLGHTGGDLKQQDPPNCYRIAVQREGRGGVSDRLHALISVGTMLKVSAPQNLFWLDRRDPFTLLVAGGIGVTPIHAMTRSLLRRQRNFAVFYVGRDGAQMPYRQTLAALAGDRFSYRETARDGRPDVLALLKRQPAGTRVYVCGPSGLTEAVRQAAAQLGWAPERVRSEHFGLAGRADDQPITLSLRQSRRTLTVGASQSILSALQSARVDVLADCQRGECGLCAQTVLDADGPLDHRDTFLTPPERAEGRSLCICVSRVNGHRLELDL